MQKHGANRVLIAMHVNHILRYISLSPNHRQLIENSNAHFRTVEILLLKGPWAESPPPEVPPPGDAPPPVIRKLKPQFRKLLFLSNLL